jgi:hypothetical protein
LLLRESTRVSPFRQLRTSVGCRHVYRIARSACVLRHPWLPILQAFGRPRPIVYVVLIALKCQRHGLRLHRCDWTYVRECYSFSQPYICGLKAEVSIAPTRRAQFHQDALAGASPQEEAVHRASISRHFASQISTRRRPGQTSP